MGVNARRLGCAGLLSFLPISVCGAQLFDPESAATDSVAVQSLTTAVAPRYRAGAIRRLFLGAGYRDLWATPVRVQLLDLARFASGLSATRAGDQTRSLRFRGADGHEYVLRSADKVAAFTVAPELHGTLVEDFIQDQVSASHPFGAAVADRLEEAAGLPPLNPRLVMLPDDSMLGTFRRQFAGMIGYIQERPEEGTDRTPGFAGFTRVIGTDALLRRRRERPKERVDVPRFLSARLVDLLLGDWDRHRDQWRWGRQHADSTWQPIPRDHDWAFGRYEGIVLSYLRHGPLPHLVRFDSGRLPVPGLTWFGRDLDRELLPRLEWATWDSVVTGLTSRLTDSVIASAVDALPAGVSAAHRSWLAALLRDRREHLPEAARRFYLGLAREADFHTTDASERIIVEGYPDGAVRIQVAAEGAGAGLDRRFDPSETREVRLYAHRGADTVVTRGAKGRIRVRVIGGRGDDVVLREGGPAVEFHQGGEDWRPLPAGGDQPPPRDWGSRTTTLPHLSASTESGVIAGLTLTHTDYGFRKFPFASRTLVQAVYGTVTARPGLYLASEVRTTRPSLRFALDAEGTGAEILRFYLPGNRSVEARDRRFHEVRNWQLAVFPAVEIVPDARLLFGFGPMLRFVESDLDAGRLIGTAGPYGSEGFGEFGARAYGRWDTRDVPTNPGRGLLLEATGRLVPGGWDAEEGFGGGSADAAAFITPFGSWSPTLALRAGGRRVWGRYPWFEAARIGGEGTLRGYSEGRFRGDAAVFGSVELRVPLARAKLLVPGRLGALGFADVGRVFLDGESSSDWHESLGGGLWFSPLGPANVVSATVARSPERTVLGLQGRMAF